MRFALFLAFLVALVGVPVALVVLAVERTPLVTDPGRTTMATVAAAEALWRRADPRRMPPGRDTVVVARAREVDDAVAAALAGFPFLSGRAVLSSIGLLVAVTAELPLPATPLGRYVNVRVAVAPSRLGLRIARLAIGGIEVPPRLVRPAARRAADLLVAPGTGRAMLDSVRSVAVADDGLVVVFRPPAGLVDDVATAARTAAGLTGLVDRDAVQSHLDSIVATAETRPRGHAETLAIYLPPLFAHARARSETRDPVAENRAALLALAIYFGDPRIARLVGEVQAGRRPGHANRAGDARLDRRRDLVQHFTVSAALAATGGSPFADAIGTAKELRDSLGGSGFSFADLAADRAGVRFAALATRSAEHARLLQERLAAGLPESGFFPSARDLPERMSRAMFTARYGDTDSPAYARMLAEIDRRIDALALYR